MAATVSGSMRWPSLSIILPRNLTLGLKKMHLSGLSLRPALFNLDSNSFKLAKCSSDVLPVTHMSSTMQAVAGIGSLPSLPCISLSILL